MLYTGGRDPDTAAAITAGMWPRAPQFSLYQLITAVQVRGAGTSR